MTSEPRGPNVILIGGEMTVDGDEVIDSRQTVEGDPWSLVAHSALTGSARWWHVVLSVVNPLLSESGEDAFAYVIGTRSVKELRSDGSVFQRRLASILPGATTNVEFDRPWERHPLPDGFVPLGTVGYRVDTSKKRWVLAGIDSPPYTAAQAIGPTVIIDSGPWPVMNASHHDDYRTFEQARLYGDVTLVLPHTARTEEFVRGYAAWIEAGRPGKGSRGFARVASNPTRWRELRDAVPVPLSDRFKVTGLIQNDQWQDPADLEAARSLLQTRFDLTFGLWDLAGNEILRRSLLDSTPLEAIPDSTAPVPTGAANRARRRAASQAAQGEDRRRSKDKIFEFFAPHGWRQRNGWIYPIVDWHGRLGDDVLLYLVLGVTNRRTTVAVSGVGELGLGVGEFLLSHVDDLEAIAAPAHCDVRQGKTLVWRSDGGWADAVDWDKRVAELADCVPRWLDVMGEMAQRYRIAQEAIEAHRIAEYKELGISEEHWRM